MKIYVKVAISKKGNKYCGLYTNLGYKELLITYDRIVISELLDKSLRELAELPVGNYDL